MSKYVAIGAERFMNQYWQQPKDFRFLAHNPVMAIGAHEVPKIGLHVPLAFVQQQDGYDLVALTGLKEEENLLVNPLNGHWLVSYLPDFAKVYPFRLAPRPNSDDLMVIVDMESGLVTHNSQDLRFFEDNGQPSQAFSEVTATLERLQRGRMVSFELCQRLQDAEVFEPWPLMVQDGDSQHQMKGLFRINEEALRGLGNVAFLALRKNNALGLAYAQMMSMGNVHTLGRLALQRQQQLGPDHPKAGYDDGFESDTISFS